MTFDRTLSTRIEPLQFNENDAPSIHKQLDASSADPRLLLIGAFWLCLYLLVRVAAVEIQLAKRITHR